MQGTRPMRTAQICRRTEATGFAQIVWPINRLLAEFECLFLAAALSILWKGRRLRAIDRVLRRLNVAEPASLVEAYFPVNVPKLKLNWTVKSLGNLAQLSDELAEDEGNWRDAETELVVDEAYSELTRDLRRGIRSVLQKYGPRAALAVLSAVRDRFAVLRATCFEELEQWTSADAESMSDCGHRLRSAAHPRKWYWRILTKLFAKLPPTMWLTRAQRTKIERHVLRELTRGAQLRASITATEGKLDLIERLLGRPGVPGFFDEVLAALKEHKELYSTLRRQLRDRQLPKLPADAIPLVRSIHDRIDSDSDETVERLFLRLARRAGCSPRNLADKLQRTGVRIDGVLYFPSDWPKLTPARLLSALLHSVRRYLGSHDRSAGLNISEPRSAAEFIASVTPGSPAIRARLDRALDELARRSHSYAAFPRMPKAEPAVYAYLYAWPTDRKLYEELLVNRVNNIANAGGDERERATKYTVDNPYFVLLAQYAIGGVGGAQRDYQRALRHANQYEATHGVESMFPEDAEGVESRILPYRTESHDDAVGLMFALQKANIAVSINRGKGTYFVPGSDPVVRYVFAPENLKPEWKPASFIDDQMKIGAFVDFIQVTYPEIEDWHELAQTLREDPRPDHVAHELERRGILTTNGHGLFQITRLPPTHHIPITTGLYRWEAGPVVGLTEDQFISELVRNDSFYNALFWRVVDALDRRRLSPSDLPPFAAQYLSALDAE